VQGDSGFIVVRNGKIAMRSSPKQHFFDCPLQFGAYPEFVDGTDTADDAEIFHLPVQPGDIVVAGGAAGFRVCSGWCVFAIGYRAGWY
jgi:protein phosphatase PTC7